MSENTLSLKWLYAFQKVAETGSVQAAADALGLAASTVSHHLSSLENHLGSSLFDHKHRPLMLTPQGTIFLRDVDEALVILERAEQVIRTPVSHGLRQLRFAMIEDFESEIGPEITQILAKALPDCQLSHFTRVSHDILEVLQAGKLDIGIATRPPFSIADLEELPLLQDPFVLAVPINSDVSSEAFIAGQSGLPFLRYTQDQLIGSMVSAQLKRLRIQLDDDFHLESTSSIMGLVAQSGGWAITTPSNYMRAQRFHRQVKLLPFPQKAFARTVSVFARAGQVTEVAQMVAVAMRKLLALYAVAPVTKEYPWLSESYRVLTDTATSQ